MRTAVSTPELAPVIAQTSNKKEPKKLSKFALWRKKNPNGILEYVDWRAADR
ncbi:MAG: hypothetical protein FWF53_07580 [Candidatus Azobacteroides sp.]|nr:hypothetical protein [Candidatus Azobacteroides sp.]